MASKTAVAVGTDAPRSILLRCGAMPNYAIVNESEAELSSLQERIERLHHEQRLQDAHLSEQAVLLHSLFSKFCYPPPSMASVLDILLLERQRIFSLNINIDNNDDNDEIAALLDSTKETQKILNYLFRHFDPSFTS